MPFLEETTYFTGADTTHTWRVPKNVFRAQFELASAGSVVLVEDVPVVPGEVLRMVLGGSPSGIFSGAGGSNGGGAGNGAPLTAGWGAVDVRRGGAGLEHRIMVAGGAGGSGVIEVSTDGWATSDFFPQSLFTFWYDSYIATTMPSVSDRNRAPRPFWPLEGELTIPTYPGSGAINDYDDYLSIVESGLPGGELAGGAAYTAGPFQYLDPYWDEDLNGPQPDYFYLLHVGAGGGGYGGGASENTRSGPDGIINGIVMSVRGRTGTSYVDPELGAGIDHSWYAYGDTPFVRIDYTPSKNFWAVGRAARW
jgi:hypothetical protein